MKASTAADDVEQLQLRIARRDLGHVLLLRDRTRGLGLVPVPIGKAVLDEVDPLPQGQRRGAILVWYVLRRFELPVLVDVARAVDENLRGPDPHQELRPRKGPLRRAIVEARPALDAQPVRGLEVDEQQPDLWVRGGVAH